MNQVLCKCVKAAVYSILVMMVGVTPSLAEEDQGQPNVKLSPEGKVLAKQYEEIQKALKLELLKSVPEVDKTKKSVADKALGELQRASAELEWAYKDARSYYDARALVGHAKVKWIGEADKGIKKAKERLKVAKTRAERNAAEKELAHWQENRKKGEEALKERQAAWEKIQKNKSKYQEASKRARANLEDAKSVAEKTVRELGMRSALASDAWDVKFAKYFLIKHAKPEGLAAFAQRGAAQKQLIDTMLSSDKLLVQMAVADGAKDGRYGEAMQIYSDIEKASLEPVEGQLQRLALAIALEHAVPITQVNTTADVGSPVIIDPVKRYLQYEKALRHGEIDPAFKDMTVWDVRMVVNSRESDEILSWSREMLRSYRPDHVLLDDYHWRYLMLMRTDVRSRKSGSEKDKPGLHPIQNILVNGGTSKRKVSLGCYILRSFGVPAFTVRQKQWGTAMGHWTPQGWVMSFGAGWKSLWVGNRYAGGLDFQAHADARMAGETFMQVMRAQWIGDLLGEKEVSGLLSSTAPGFWYAVSFYMQKDIAEEVREAASQKNKQAKSKKKAGQIPAEAKKIKTAFNRVITIPAVACSNPYRSSFRVALMPSNLGGMQLHFRGYTVDEQLHYSFNVADSGTYVITARVASLGQDQEFLMSLNGAEKPERLVVPFTLGLWGETKPVEVALSKGKNELTISHASANQRGVTIKEFILKPVN